MQPEERHLERAFDSLHNDHHLVRVALDFQVLIERSSNLPLLLYIWPRLNYGRTLINYRIFIFSINFQKSKMQLFRGKNALGPPTCSSSIDRAPRGAESDAVKRLWVWEGGYDMVEILLGKFDPHR